MKRNDLKNRDRTGLAWRVFWIAALHAMFMVFSTSRAHTLMESRGDIVVHSDLVIVNLIVDAEDLQHWEHLTRNERGDTAIGSLRAAADRHAIRLGRIMAVRGTDGRRLKCDPIQSVVDWPEGEVLSSRDLRKLRIAYNVQYPTAIQPHLLTFQLDMSSSGASEPWQMTLSLGCDGRSERVPIRLTSGGNAETVELLWNGGVGALVSEPGDAQGSGVDCCRGRRGAARFREIFADMVLGDGGVEARIVIPLPLFQTWSPIPRRDPDFISPVEQAASLPAVRDLFAKAMSVSAGAMNVKPDVTAVEFIPADEVATTTGESTDISIWTGAVAAHLRFPLADAPAPDDAIDVCWRLFNNVVLNIHAAVRSNGSCTEHVFSMYDPMYTLNPAR